MQVLCVETYPQIADMPDPVDTDESEASSSVWSRHPTPPPSTDDAVPEITTVVLPKPDSPRAALTEAVTRKWSFKLPHFDMDVHGTSQAWVNRYNAFSRDGVTAGSEVLAHYSLMLAVFTDILTARLNFCGLVRQGLLDRSSESPLPILDRFSRESDNIEVELSPARLTYPGNMRAYYPDLMRIGFEGLRAMDSHIGDDLSSGSKFIFELPGLIGKRVELERFRAAVLRFMNLFHGEFNVLVSYGFYQRGQASFLGVKVHDRAHHVFRQFKRQVLNNLVDLLYEWQHVTVLDTVPADTVGPVVHPYEAEATERFDNFRRAGREEGVFDHTSPNYESFRPPGSSWEESADVFPARSDSPALERFSRMEKETRQEIAATRRAIAELDEQSDALLATEASKQIYLVEWTGELAAMDDKDPVRKASLKLKITQAGEDITSIHASLRTNFSACLQAYTVIYNSLLQLEQILSERIRHFEHTRGHETDAAKDKANLRRCREEQVDVEAVMKSIEASLIPAERYEDEDSPSQARSEMQALSLETQQLVDTLQSEQIVTNQLIHDLAATHGDATRLSRVVEEDSVEERAELSRKVDDLMAKLLGDLSGLPGPGLDRLRDLQRDQPRLYKAWLRASTGAKPLPPPCTGRLS